MDLHTIIDNFSYIAIFILMTTNGVVNFPSSQLLYIISGYFVSTGNLYFLPTILAGALGNTLGNCITFLLVKKHGKVLARKLLMMDEETFTKVYGALHDTFSKRGLWYIFIGKLIPSVKAFIPVLAGISRTKTEITSFIFLIASLLWATAITSLGYFFGEQVTWKAFGIVSLLIGGAVIFIVYKKISKKL